MEGIKNFSSPKLKYVLNVVRMVGIEPTTSILSVWRSTTELHAQYITFLLCTNKAFVSRPCLSYSLRIIIFSKRPEDCSPSPQKMILRIRQLRSGQKTCRKRRPSTPCLFGSQSVRK